MDCSPSGSSVFGISQARILEWVAISFSRGSSWPRDWICISWITGRFFTTREPPGKQQGRHYQMPKIHATLAEPKLGTYHGGKQNKAVAPILSHQLTWPHSRGKNRVNLFLPCYLLSLFFWKASYIVVWGFFNITRKILRISALWILFLQVLTCRSFCLATKIKVHTGFVKSSSILGCQLVSMRGRWANT